MKRYYVDAVVAEDPSVIQLVRGVNVVDSGTYTDRLVQVGARLGIYRQCSIGYHGECSAEPQRGEDSPCACKCHVDPFHETVIVGRMGIAGSVYTVRVQQGEVDLGWLAPGWIEGQDERWITVEPEALPAINALLQQAAEHMNRTATGASE
ncbi:hypothetical protein FDH47_gp44 [Arthrobacter phage Brent]|uniref:Uncharacterized protein n=2 Tax=Marthavirus brent TaxID=1980948 RepID=A0A222Z2W8_9CAUD|nr:hypothetical protein FDH47_gp44 [Arthrobacter phage Brent]ALF01255.1 hypothetical protein SEA_BRENT_44 [Arthrobacter phage Brent]ASR78146.1 hypothetical protein SEA_FRANZY_44 [Arthrobacter phage Franzy]